MGRTLYALYSAAILTFAPAMQAADVEGDNSGLIRLKSYHSVAKTAERLEAALAGSGMVMFARIDHSAADEGTRRKLRPTEVVIFGDPGVGAQLLECEQSAAIDLPQKALIWEDESGEVWYAYNRPAWLKQRHDIDGCRAVISRIEHSLADVANTATRAE